MTDAIVGLDIGGTKTAIVVDAADGTRLVDRVVASEDWDAEPIEHGAAWIAARIRDAVPPGVDVRAIGLGAQGLDTAEIAREVESALADPRWHVVAVNDAALLVPAAGHDAGIGLIAGTGAIGVGADSAGAPLITGGWGWAIGDEAGAAGLVREATRAALLAHDDGAPDDGLLAALLAAFAVPDAERLARAVNDEPTMDNWGPRAPAVFDAADGGSALARAVIEGGADHLARLVDQLVRRGAVGTHVVAAGSVIAAQPRLFDAVVDRVRARHPALTVELLRVAPVEGALALARRALPAYP